MDDNVIASAVAVGGTGWVGWVVWWVKRSQDRLDTLERNQASAITRAEVEAMIRSLDTVLSRRSERMEERLTEIDRATVTREELKDAVQAMTQSLAASEGRIMAALAVRLGNGVNGHNGHAD